MPETTETATFERTPEELFGRLADFGNLADWDPMFDSSERLDDGPLGVGSRFRVVGSLGGSTIELLMEVIEYEPPSHVLMHGTGEGLRTRESIRLEPHLHGGSEVTYHSSYETDLPDLVDALQKPAFVVIGKRAMSGMRDWLGS